MQQTDCDYELQHPFFRLQKSHRISILRRGQVQLAAPLIFSLVVAGILGVRNADKSQTGNNLESAQQVFRCVTVSF